MPRGRSISKKKVQPDEVYKSERVGRFINYVMVHGKKDKAKNIVYAAMQKAGEKVGEEPVVIFEKALGTLRPDVEVRSRRVGGSNYQIPVPVPQRRGEALAMRWLIEAARNRKGKPMADNLAEELVNAYNEEGDAVKKKENIHKMADANRAFAHFKW